MTPRIRNSFCLLVVLMVSITAHGQGFRNRSDIEPVDKDGFYSITITPELSSYVKSDFSDLLIRDEKNNPVAYLLNSRLPVLKQDFFKPLKIINNTLTDSGQTMLIIENTADEKIDGLSLKIKNAAVSRTINISGSNNLGDWYSIAEDIILERKYVQDNDSYIENIEFPLSSYRYFRILIYNFRNDPLNIFAAGRRVQTDPNPVPPIENPTLQFIRKDSNDHITYLTVYNPSAYHISFVGLQTTGPKFFKRQVDIVNAQGQEFGNFLISSDKPVRFSLPVFNDSSFQVRIYNGDNAPLDVSALTTGQYTEKIITYLEAGKRYQLEMSNEKAIAPHYDLLNFKDSIPVLLTELKLSKTETTTAPKTKESNSFFNRYSLWAVITVVLLVLLFFTLRLVREMRKQP